ncbi:MAG: DEAD/DEAH box helicase family protein [Myxococcota bacterium]|nr:DEAD/DEAH box helicase family protein [Myxococcota bacterium]
MTLLEIELRFVAGTIEIRGLREEMVSLLPAGVKWDPRTSCFRAPALSYAEITQSLSGQSSPIKDSACGYGDLGNGLQVRRTSRYFQEEALEAWKNAAGRGVVVLPTGAGKSYVALLAMDSMRKHTLVVAPTLDLVSQWYDLIRSSFGMEVGVIGGGEHSPKPITVTTYDSAYMHMENLGAKFGLVIFDECHHLPSDAYSLAAQSCLAPYRLGLTATPERADGKDVNLNSLIGPLVYRRDIGELTGEHLADYRVEQILVELTPKEREGYNEARQIYLQFIRSQGIRMSAPDGWAQFVIRSSLSAEGRGAMKSYQRQKHLAFAAPSKLGYVEHLLHRHRRDRVLLFTERNQSAYEMSRRFLVPVITHQTKVSERSEILRDFSEGTYNALATSKVLNEGVDMPEANVGIIMSGSGSVREHVQRLGRILRKKGDKKAILYELVANDTSEMRTSNRRRDHVAYS